jgi:competence protein ComEC
LLSLAGVLGLIFLTGPLRDLLPIARPPALPPAASAAGRLRQQLRRSAEHALLAGCATLAATLCTAPLQAAAFHRVSIIGVLANALALWPGLCAIPVATLAVPLDALAPPAALLPLWLADLCAAATLRAASLFSSLAWAQVALPRPGPVATLLWFAALLAVAGFPAPLGPGTSAHRPPARIRLLRASLPLALLAVAASGGAAFARLSSSLTVTFFAVGQGDAALVTFPGGRTMLVDAGGDLFGRAGRDASSRDLLPALAELGVGHLDWAVLTHPHPDHGGGFPAVLRKIPVTELWTTGEPGPADLGDRLRALAAAHGVRLVVPVAGQRLEVGGARVEVLHPARWDDERGPNDNSLVLRLVHGKNAILLAGDIEALAEADIAHSVGDIEATLLKVPHHGSRTSSTDAFLRRVRPSHVVFCVGERNPFGLPHRDVVERYRAAGCTLFRTDRGAVTAESDGAHLRLRQDSG